MREYHPRQIESHWQAIWQKKSLYRTPKKPGKAKYYSLVMFPYPSGDLHIGHWYNFAPADVFTRFMRMRGKKVLNPVGFDAFGLPAEGAAIERGIHPALWTKKNIKRMTSQLKSMGASYDWERAVITADPLYYRWTQWMFLQMYKDGLAYKKKATANWCPKCRSILANEQAEGGVCWRCETQVEQREIDQWFFKITKYADELLRELSSLNWPEKTKMMQKNWIGRSEGTEIKFPIPNSKFQIPVFTTRPDTLFGTTFIAIAPEYWHANLRGLPGSKPRVKRKIEEYVEKARKKTELERMAEIKEKTGVFTGVYVQNPSSGEKIPVYVADFVLMTYGTGAIMGVPGHDQRDWDFARQHQLPIREVISGGNVKKEAYTGEGKLVNSGKYNGLPSTEAIKKITKDLKKLGLGKKSVQYHLRDWLVSRQRYWGAPIPMVYCPKCGIVPVAEKDLPVLLPKVKNYLPVEGESPLARAKDWVKVACPKCRAAARRETDTMDTFVCSSWYFLRYADPKNKKEFASKKALKTWLPVDMYIGGAEHTVLHLLYSRFFVKALRDMGYLDFDEPFLSLRHQGTILGEDGYKMSKSRGNVVDPDELVKKFGADTVRIYLCFMGPYHQGGPWSSRGIMGIYRFLNRVWRLVSEASHPRGVPQAQHHRGGGERLMHQTIKKVTEDIKKFKFNTAIAAIMEFVNEITLPESPFRSLRESPSATPGVIETLLLLLAPFAPHLTEELWTKVLGKKFSIHKHSWAKYDPKLAKEEMVTVVIQVNGKLRERLIINHQSSIIKSEIEKLARESERVQKYLQGKKIKKVIFVPARLINFVTS